MSTKYLLPCDCGQSIPIETSQAGDFVTCQCGVKLEAPTFRNIRHLPLAEEQDATNASSGGGWGLRQGVITLSLLLTLLFAGLGAYVWANDPVAPKGFDPISRSAAISQGLEKMTPVDAYMNWIQHYKPLRQLAEMSDPREQVMRQILAKRAAIRWSLLAVAGACALGGVLAVAVLPKAKQA